MSVFYLTVESDYFCGTQKLFYVCERQTHDDEGCEAEEESCRRKCALLDGLSQLLGGKFTMFCGHGFRMTGCHVHSFVQRVKWT